ncbi:ABC transporter permease [Clostridium sartagoforme]|uniref:ABC transporter permease n=1 Tax=Clostridium sartagoforme TaxID=84031 RepID=UPI0031E090D0
MLNYIRADIYRNLNRKYFWIYTGIIAAMSVLVTVLFKISSIPDKNFNLVLDIATQAFTLPIYLVGVFVEMATSDEQKNKTFKNVVSFGVTRNTIAISKVITAVILSMLSAFIILTAFSISGLIFLGGPSDFLSEFLIRFALASVLWIAAISIGTFISLVFNSSNISAFVYFGIFLMTKNIIAILSLLVWEKFSYLNNYLISTKLNILASEPLTIENIGPAILVGVVYTVVFTGLSMLYLRKKEIK